MRTWNNYKADDNTALQDAYERGFRDGYNFMALDEKDSDPFWDDDRGEYPISSQRHDDLLSNLAYYFMVAMTQVATGADASYSDFDFIDTLNDIEKAVGLPKRCLRDELYFHDFKTLLLAKEHNSDQELEKYFKKYSELLVDISQFLAVAVVNPEGNPDFNARITVGDVRKAIQIIKNSLQGTLNKKEMRSVMRHCRKLSAKMNNWTLLIDKRKIR